MKAAIIGYGKMGREIEKILIERGHDVTLVIDTDNAADLNAANLAGVDVALEFTMPSTAYANIRTCIENATPVVSGTTGWTDRLGELQQLCREKGGALFYTSNYCLGVNLMFRLNRQLAAMIDRVGGYDAKIEEVALRTHTVCRAYSLAALSGEPQLLPLSHTDGRGRTAATVLQKSHTQHPTATPRMGDDREGYGQNPKIPIRGRI